MSENYRINGFDQIKAFYSWVFNNPDKIRPTHISLYLFLWNQANRANWVEWFKCPYDLAMQGACIGNNGTYYRCLDDLKLFKLIDYQKGVNNFKAPLVHLIRLYDSEQVTEQVAVPLSEQVTEQQHVQQYAQLPAHIYKLITDNQKLITINEKEFSDFVLNLGKPKKEHGFILPEFKEAIDLWLSYKKERKQPYKSEKSIKAAYEKLVNLSGKDPSNAILIVKQSMAANWSGMFELKEQVKKEDLDILGYNENYIQGKRMYNRKIEIPKGTPPCPSNMHHWNSAQKEWAYGN